MLVIAPAVEQTSENSRETGCSVPLVAWNLVTAASSQSWRDFHRRWPQLRPPLRANGEVVSALAELIAGRDERLLLLGVTPELSALGQNLTAADWSEEMIASIWRGDCADRRAVRANWLELPGFMKPFSAMVGDGSLNMLHWPEDYEKLFDGLSRALAPGGRIAVRCYLAPETGETAGHLAAEVRTGTVGFHAFKWRLAMMLARQQANPNVPVRRIHEMFATLFPDRAALAIESGWPVETIAEIDAYQDSAAIYSFPTADELLSAAHRLSNPRLVPAGTYELAERCPIFVADVPA